jgi:hypothetical protein
MSLQKAGSAPRLSAVVTAASLSTSLGFHASEVSNDGKAPNLTSQNKAIAMINVMAWS